MISIIQKPGVFISHIHEDQAISNALEAFIRRVLLGAVEVFNAANRESIRPGDPWRDLIVEHLKNDSVTIILASPQAVSRPWINFEGGGAWIAGNRVVPCCISNMTPSNLPAPLGHLQAIELCDPEGLGTLVQLLADVCGLDCPSGLDYSTEAAKFRKLWEERDNAYKLNNLFTKERGFRSEEALILFKESMKSRHISKWGVVVPLFESNYDVMISIRFRERYLGAMAHFLPAYAIDAQNILNVGIMRWSPKSGQCVKL